MRNTIVLALAVLAGACSATTSSRNIRTAGVVVLIDVTSETEGQSVVTTDLVIGGSSSNTFMVLEGGDRMYAEASGQRREMNATSDGEYEAKFGSSEGEFLVSMQRDVDAPAPNNRGTLPPPFTITSEFGDEPLSRKKDKVKLTWTPGGSGSDVEIEIRGDCIHTERFAVGGDPGAYTIGKKKITAWKSKAKQACTVIATITHTRLGSIDPALDSDSRFRLRQVRQVRFVSGP